MKEILKRIIAESWDFRPHYMARRKVPAELVSGKPSIVVTGPRRAGKSYTLHEMRDALAGGNAGWRDFVYVNFEDERLSDFNKSHFDLLLDAYYEMREQKPAVFLDEPHNVDGWNQFARRLADSGYKVVVTGSNSRMLSREIAEKLGGRFVDVTVYPLDFAEFLKFKGMDFKKEYFYSSERFAIIRYFDEYLHFGGFPEAAGLSGGESKKKLLQTYFDLVFYKDLVAGKKLDNEAALMFIIKKLRESIGTPITPRAIYSAAKNAGVEVGPNTVEKYLDYLEEAFLVLPCLPYAKSVRKQERKKRYLVDNGYASLFEVKEDNGILLENLVFTELVKRGKKACYHSGKRECDFVVEGSEAVQAAFELNASNEAREIGGLLEAMQAYGIGKGVIVTNGQEKELEEDGRKIRVVPAWKWLLE